MKPSIESMPSRFERVHSVRHAIDDLYGGDYGAPCAARCEMPVVAVVGAAFGAASLAGAFGALTVWGTVAAIGSVVAGVGALVGDPDLMKVGGVMSLAGGVGGFASGEGMTLAASEAANGGTTSQLVKQSSEFVSSPTAEVAAGMDYGGAASGAQQAGGDLAMKGTVINNTAGPGVLQESLNTAGTGDPTAVSGTVAEAQARAAVPVADVGQASADLGQGLINAPGAGPTADIANGLDYPGGDFWSSLTGKFGNLSKWANDNKATSEALLKGIGGFAETFTDQYQAKTDYYRSASDLYGARAEAERQQTTNANYAPNIADRFALAPAGTTPFKTAASTYRAPGVGLINARA